MKNVLSKILLLVLVVATLISTLAILGSCSDEKKKDKDDDDEVNADVEDNLSDLPKTKFNEDFIVVCRDEGAEFWRENADGDKVDYAIYMRNRAIEEKFGVDIKPKHMEYHEIPAWVADILKANDQKSMDIVNNHIVYSSNIPLAGNATDLQTVPYLKFEEDWWLDSTLNDLTLNGKTFIAIGDMNTSAISATYCMYYNKDLVKEYKIPDESGDMYKLAIEDGEWTYSKMISLLGAIRADLNSDGRYTDQDRYGLVTEGMSFANAYLWAWENPIFSKNENSGEIEFSFMRDGTKISKILDNIITMYGRTDGVYQVESAKGAEMFVNSQAVFLNSTFGGATSSLRSMDAEKWGIVPYPKYNKKQTNYVTAVDGGHNAICVPKTTNEKKLEKIGAITESLNRLSRLGESNLVTEFYDKGLKAKYLGDPKEAQVINLIMDNRVFDFGYIYLAFDSPAFWIQDMVKGNDKDISGKYTANRTNLEGVIEKAYEAFGLSFPGLP